MRLAFVGLIVMLGAGIATGATPVYLWAEVPVQTTAVAALPDRALALEIPLAMWQEEGLILTGAKDTAELLGQEFFLFFDEPYFLLVMQTRTSRAAFRGGPVQAELIAGGDSDVITPPPAPFFDLLTALGLLPTGCTVELTVRDVPLKLPRTPEGIRLDPVLWALVLHPDWIGFANDYALELVGLRVRVVAETTGRLAENFEPYIVSSSDGLTELLIPIPLLPELGRDPAVRLVRPPYVPYPAQG